MRKITAKGIAMMKYSSRMTGIAAPRTTTMSVYSVPSMNEKIPVDGRSLVTRKIAKIVIAIPTTAKRIGRKKRERPILVQISMKV